jgi:hypothetical protein
LAQNGAFIIFGMESELSDNNDLDIDIMRIPVPASVKDIMMSDLDKLDVNHGTMFPEIESRAKYIASKYP